jgi:hypothetical protein
MPDGGIDREGEDAVGVVLAATSSMSMPPSVEQTKAMREVARSTRSAR